jgi:Fe-S cluster biogenesis protein NfuA
MSNQQTDPSVTTADRSFAQSMRRIEELVHQIEDIHDPHARDLARGLTQALLDLHAQGLRRMIASLDPAARSRADVRRDWLGDPLVSNLLVLHGLHPVELSARVAQALDKVRPRLATHAAEVTLLAASEDAVRLRLVDGSSGCPATVQSLRGMVENALLEWAADVLTVTWDESTNGRVAPAGFVPLARLVEK